MYVSIIIFNSLCNDEETQNQHQNSISIQDMVAVSTDYIISFEFFDAAGKSSEN